MLEEEKLLKLDFVLEFRDMLKSPQHQQLTRQVGRQRLSVNTIGAPPTDPPVLRYMAHVADVSARSVNQVRISKLKSVKLCSSEDVSTKLDCRMCLCRCNKRIVWAHSMDVVGEGLSLQ